MAEARLGGHDELIMVGIQEQGLRLAQDLLTPSGIDGLAQNSTANTVGLVRDLWANVDDPSDPLWTESVGGMLEEVEAMRRLAVEDIDLSPYEALGVEAAILNPDYQPPVERKQEDGTTSLHYGKGWNKFRFLSREALKGSVDPRHRGSFPAESMASLAIAIRLRETFEPSSGQRFPTYVPYRGYGGFF
jgi:hypothetical protein